ncbi:MAG: uridine diphosphate-N-acetylglucosamine-binding protein YvcK [Nostocoides sp.]
MSDAVPTQERTTGTAARVVALGGGHGLSASLSALRLLTDHITAVVTVADDGGSSGRLREEFGVLPPGDLRMALAALCDDTEWGHTWRDVLQHRFSGWGELGGHALGNLLIVALWEQDENPVTGLQLVGQLLGARGAVVPMAAVPLDISARVRGLVPGEPDADVIVHGQAQVAKTSGEVIEVTLSPQEPPACPEAVLAVQEADWVILGPGSWFTSVMPHLLVPHLRAALETTLARRILTLNVELNTQETSGFTAVRHLETLSRHAPDMRFDIVLVDPSIVEDASALNAAADAIGAQLVIAPVAGRRRPGTHDSLRLAAAYRDIMGGGLGEP